MVGVVNGLTLRWLVLILAIGAATGLVFGLYPQLDLHISALFYDPAGRTWPASQSALFNFYRNLGAVVATAMIVLAVAALAVASVRKREPSFISLRAGIFLVGSFLLGPGLITNVLLKPQWGRPRPGEVPQFGGHLDFTPWWNPHGACDSNCSFVSGEESLAVWLVAWAVVLPERYRGAGMLAVLLHCVFMAADRIATGAHFTSDVLFAVVVTALSIWVMHWLVFRGQALSPTSPGPGGRRRDLAAVFGIPSLRAE
jgi:membrane-associated PAP2 superfamily phosphatase